MLKNFRKFLKYKNLVCKNQESDLIMDFLRRMLLFLRFPRHLFSDERVVTAMSSLDSVRGGLKCKIDEFD